MTRKKFLFSLPLAAFACAALLSACTSNNPLRHETAVRLAAPAFMVERQIGAGIFSLTAFERMHERHTTANLYIEGDGSTNDPGDFMVGETMIWAQNDPQSPTALMLATQDDARNVVYLARPCQYSGMRNPEAECGPEYFTSEAYSAEVLAAYNEALDKIKRRDDITAFNLVGFQGGGTIAAILASTRNDIVSLRTVAANLDNKLFSAANDMTPYSRSLNAVDFAQRLRRMPQVHFTGGQDETTPVAVLDSYLSALGPTNCVHTEFIQEAGYKNGWMDKWAGLLQIQPTCRGPQVDPATPPMSYMPDRIRATRERPMKP